MGQEKLILEDMGLTSAQAKVYLALIDLGSTTTGSVIKKSKLQNSVVYNALNQLIEEGLASFVYKGRTKYFSATNPNNLITYINDKKQKVEEIVPSLKSRKKLALQEQSAQVFQGWKGVYHAFNSILNNLPKGSEYIGFGAGFEDQYTLESKQFFREFHKKRSARKYKVKLITNEKNRGQVEDYNYYSNFGCPQFRYVDGFAPQGIIIYADKILTVAFDDEPIAIIITSKKIAESYRNFFNAMWKIAKK